MSQIFIASRDTVFIDQIRTVTGYDTVIAADESEFYNQKFNYFAVFFDITALPKPQETFFKLLLRRQRVIIVSTVDDSDTAAECLQQGARDYLIKPTHPALIQKRLEMMEVLAGAKERLDTRIHDAKQPLATILGYASLLKNPERFEKIPHEMRQNMFDSIHNGAVRLREMLDRFDGFGI
jgi:DNA-binding NarL/FixJ family response regulator